MATQPELKAIQAVLLRVFGEGTERFWIAADGDTVTLTDAQTRYRLQEGTSLAACLEALLQFEGEVGRLDPDADPEAVEERFWDAVLDLFEEVEPDQAVAPALQERTAACPHCGTTLTLSAEFLAKGHVSASDRVMEAGFAEQVGPDGEGEVEVFLPGACLSCQKPWNAELRFKTRVTVRHGIEVAAIHALTLASLSLHEL